MSEPFDFDLQEISFEWDEEKDRINFMKHGIRFRTAAKVFLDPYRLIREDLEHPEEQSDTDKERKAFTQTILICVGVALLLLLQVILL